MISLTIELPDWLHKSIQGLAEQEGYTIDHFLASAAAEKMAAIQTLDYLRKEASQAALSEKRP